MGFECFYAVTQNSFYLAALDERGQPYLVKLLGRDNGDAPPGCRTTGELLAVAAIGVFFYHQDYSPFSGPRKRAQRPEEVNVNLWQGGTSGIVGLFLDYGQALACFQAPDPKPLDGRWRKQTQEVLTAIGPDHPKFILSDHAKLRFDQAGG